MTAATIPAILDVRRPYESEPAITALGHTTATERDLYQRIVAEATAQAKRLARPVAVLDICSAGGGSACHVSNAVTCSSLVLVDIDETMCAAARNRDWPIRNVSVQCADAVQWRSPEQFDLILANSAYHHIEDCNKVGFLANLAELLATDGRIIVGDHFLPDYSDGDLEAYRASVLLFYTQRIGELEGRGDSKDAVDVIRQTGRYCWEQRYEFQVSMRVFKRDVAAAKLVSENAVRVWPQSDSSPLPDESGSYCVVLRRLDP